MRKSILFIVIGILLLAVDIRLPFGKAYPAMVTAGDLGKEFQSRVIDHFIGTRPTIDIIPDLLGFAFVFIGSAFLIKKSRRFIMAVLLTPAAGYLNITMMRLPYHFQGRDLYLKEAGYYFLIVIIEILIEYFVIHGIVTITDCMQNKWQINELLGAWIVAMLSKGVLAGIDFFYGRKIFYIIYSLIMIGATFFYIYRIFTTLQYKPEVNG